MEKIDNKNKVTLIVLWVLILLVVSIGATFAYFRAVAESKPQIITTEGLTFNLDIEGSTNVDDIKPTIWNESNLTANENNEDVTVIPFKVYSSTGVKGIYKVRMTTNITENDLYEGGSAEDIKYKVYNGSNLIKSGNFTTGNFDVEIVNGVISDNGINDNYRLYVYIENKNTVQNKLQGISFIVKLIGTAEQTS